MDNGDIFDDFALERLAKSQFGVQLDIEKVIVRGVDVGHSAKATVFLSTKKQLYCYIYGPARLLLGDVKKIAARMNLRPEMYLPPKGRPTYFDDIGREKFRTVFPGRKDVHESDIMFYRTLAPYSPALFLVSEIIDGTIRKADSDARGGWRAAAKFTYRRIKTS